MKLLKALWNALRDILLGLMGGLLGAQIAIYLINKETFPLLIGTVIVLAIIMFFVYLGAKEDIVA